MSPDRLTRAAVSANGRTSLMGSTVVAAPPRHGGHRHSVTVSACRWATFHLPPSRRYTWVARRT